MNNYYEKQAAKKARYENLSLKLADKSSQLWDQAKKMSDVIPFGQPIMVGHHSERADRNYRDRIHNTCAKSVEIGRRADYYAERAERIENNTAISSDAPDALDRLRAKLEGLEKRQSFMVAANKIVRSKKMTEAEKVTKIMDLGIKEESAKNFLVPDQWGRVGFPSYALSNGNGNIKNVKDRIASLEKRATQTTQEKEVNGVKFVDNVEENRMQIFFPGKPGEEIRTFLKKNGFRWAPSNGAWQGYRNWRSKDAVKELIQKLSNENQNQ